MFPGAVAIVFEHKNGAFMDKRPYRKGTSVLCWLRLAGDVTTPDKNMFADGKGNAHEWRCRKIMCVVSLELKQQQAIL